METFVTKKVSLVLAPNYGTRTKYKGADPAEG